MKTLNNEIIILSATGVVTIGGKQLIFDNNTAMYNMLQWYDVKELALIYFRYV